MISPVIADALVDDLEARLWGDPVSPKERAASVHAICNEIMDWRNPAPVPARLKPDPAPGLRYWLEGDLVG